MNDNHEVAMLVYDPDKSNRSGKKCSFDGNKNCGANVVIELLQRAGIPVGFCTPETAKKHRVVLVPMTSQYDAISLYRRVHALSDWQRGSRTFTVVAGGFGMQNPIPIRNMIDVALFGRAEGIIELLVAGIIDGKTYEHESIMWLPEITPVTIAQPAGLLKLECYNELSTGCNVRCKFCHYAFSRIYTGEAGGEYLHVQLADTTIGKTWREETWWNLKNITEWIHLTKTAIDGSSERLRFAFGKHISDDDIVTGIEHMGTLGQGKGVFMRVYNIGNLPTETKEDEDQLRAAFVRANPESPVTIVLQNTPFAPSPATPMQWAAASLYPSMHAKKGPLCITEKVRVFNTHTSESSYSHFKNLVTTRATIDSDNLFHNLATNKKLSSMCALDAMRVLHKNYDIEQYTREYSLGEEPTWFLDSFFSKSKMYRLYTSSMRAAER